MALRASDSRTLFRNGLLCFGILLLIFVPLTPSLGVITFERTSGGTRGDGASSVEQTTEGGYIIGGTTSSFGIGMDFYLIKTDSLGNPVWTKNHGRSSRIGARQALLDLHVEADAENPPHEHTVTGNRGLLSVAEKEAHCRQTGQAIFQPEVQPKDLLSACPP